MTHPRARRSTYTSSSVAVAGGRMDQSGTGSFSDADLGAAFDRFEQSGPRRTGASRTAAGGGGGRGGGRGGGPGRGGTPAGRPPGRKRRDPLWARR
jgi:hypothetical protein